MCNKCSHDKIIAKIQHFSDMLNQILLEKRSLHVILDDKILKQDLDKEIAIYQEISHDYEEIFKNIICTD